MVSNLTISVRQRGGRRAKVVDDVSFRVSPTATLGIVGESGSGKTMTSFAIIGLLPSAARVDAGEIMLQGRDLLRMSEKDRRHVRGSRICMVMQDPMTALDPSFTIRSQLLRSFRRHRHLHGRELRAAMVSSLKQVHLSAAQERLRQYPHQLSGGMRQRVTSAIALAGQPVLLIADEPTTALDMITQAHYLQVLRELQETYEFALMLIAHDLMIVRQVCERVIVMYAGQAVEEGTVEEVFSTPLHPYTRALLGAIPVLGESVRLDSIDGQAPDPSEDIQGCRFAVRCKFARDVCRTSPPPLSSRNEAGRTARCWGTDIGGWIDQ